MAEATQAVAGAVSFHPYPYTLGARCGSEFIATAIALYLGDSVVANALLQKTKGHGISFAAVAFGFGFPFGLVNFMLSHISSVCNPAIFAAQWVLGSIGAREFFALSFSSIAGGFMGGVLMWFTYLPHFNIVPEPPRSLILGDGSERDRQKALNGTLPSRPRTLRTPSLLIPKPSDLLGQAGRGYGESVLNVASYEDDQAAREAGLPGALHNLRLHLESSAERSREDAAALEEALAHTQGEVRERVQRVLHHVKASTVEHEAEHARLKSLTDNSGVQTVDTAKALAGGDLDDTSRTGGRPDGSNDESLDLAQRGGSRVGRISNWVADALGPGYNTEHDINVIASKESRDDDDKSSLGGDAIGGGRARSVIDIEAEQALARYRAMVKLDKNIKLSTFTSRPAIYNPIHNILAEFTVTCALVFIIVLVSLRANTLYQPARQTYSSMIPGWVGITVACLILTIGGATGPCANPARDIGPRLAHMVLPIPGKGSSEWLSYGWITSTIPVLGGVAAGGFVEAYLKMNRSFVAEIAV